MMVTFEQVQQGLLQYINDEILNKASGLPKWGIGIMKTKAVVMLAEKARSSMDALKSIGYASEDGMIDIDRIYSDAKAMVQEVGPVVQHFPVIGDIRFTEADIDSLRRCIGG